MKKISLVAFLVAQVIFLPTFANAEGALAIGTTGNLDDGFAIGWQMNDSSADDAAKTALKECSEYPNSRVNKLCEIVATLHRQCFAFAGTPTAPGAGWVTANDQASANSRAMAICATTAGKARAAQCKVTSSACDTADK